MMRRKDREVKDFRTMLELIEEEAVIRLALCDEAGCYIVPLNYGYEVQGEDLIFYTHGALEGRRAEAFRTAAETGRTIPFEIDGRHEAVVDDGCDASYRYMSVLGNASIEILEGEDCLHGLEMLMNNIMPSEKYNFSDSVVSKTMVCRFTVKDWSCKKH